MKRPFTLRGNVNSSWRAVSFTLIEMLLVLVTLAVLTGTMVVMLAGRQDRHALCMAAKDLATAIRFSKVQAKLSRLPHRIAFYDNLTKYRVEASVSSAADDFVPAHGQCGRMKSLVEGVCIAAVCVDGQELDTLPEVLQQDPRGDGFHGQIRLKNRTGESITIEVAPGTGQVRIAGWRDEIRNK